MARRRNIVLFAEGDVGLQFCRQATQESRWDELAIVGLFATGRGDEDCRHFVDFAAEHLIPLLDKPSDVMAIPDIWMGFSVGNTVILEPDVLNAPLYGFINFHAAPLPRFSGFAAPAFAILEGHREYGVTFHKMVDDLDAGPIVATRGFKIDEASTAHEIDAQCIAVGVECFAERLSGFHPIEFFRRTKSAGAPAIRT